jgi:hypothetical protein
VNFASTLTFKTPRDLFEAPAIEKKIVNAGFGVRLKDGRRLNNPAKLAVSFQNATPVVVTTTADGIVATASDHPAGSGLSQLAAMVHGKNVDGTWTVRVVSLPSGVATDDIDELFLLLRCEFAV